MDISEKIDYFNLYMGIPVTGQQVAYRYIDLGRQTGKTTTMVKALPEDGNCVVVFYNQNFKQHFLDMVARERPEVKVENIKVVTGATVWEVEEKIRGVKLPVFFDNAFFDLQLVKMIDDFYKRNA